MNQYNFQDCLDKDLLRKIPPSREKAESSIRTANKWLVEAEANLLHKSFNSCVLSAYLVMFHSARAMLYIDGFREKSHFCISRYLEEAYVKTGLLNYKWVELLDHYRAIRHDDQYNVSFSASESESQAMLDTAKQFLDQMSKLLYNKLQR